MKAFFRRWFQRSGAREMGGRIEFLQRYLAGLPGLLICCVSFTNLGPDTPLRLWIVGGLLASILLMAGTMIYGTRYLIGRDGVRINRRFFSWSELRRPRFVRRRNQLMLDIATIEKAPFWKPAVHSIQLKQRDSTLVAKVLDLYDQFKNGDSPDIPPSLFVSPSEYREASPSDIDSEKLASILTHPKTEQRVRVRVAELLIERGEGERAEEALEELLCPEANRALRRVIES